MNVGKSVKVEDFLYSTFKMILKVNLQFFPFIYLVSVFFLLIESFSYVGLVRKFFGISSAFCSFLALLSLILFLLSACDRKVLGTKGFFLALFLVNLGSILFVPSFLLYFLMIRLNSINYSNYVYSVYHLRPEVFVFVVNHLLFLFVSGIFLRLRKTHSLFDVGKWMVNNTFFSLFGFASGPVSGIVGVTERFASLVSRNISVVVSSFILFLGLVYYSFTNLPVVLHYSLNNFLYFIDHVHFSHDELMRERWGVLYDYLVFVTKNTEDNATIVIPPAVSHWQNLGNGAISNYFLYPRKLRNGFMNKLPEDDFDYVMIAKGNWQADGEEYGWPKFDVEGEEIIYFDVESRRSWRENKSYSFSEAYNLNAWGLIKMPR